jgi:TP901 family phage tail tape measure protein
LAAAAQDRALAQSGRGAASAALSFVGLRGATLAATGPFLAGAAGAIALGKAIGIATSFNSELAVFAATTGATADEMERVSEAAKQLGKDITLPGVSASDAAESMTELAKAGLSVNDSIAATRGVLQLATAAQLSNADAVELTANALNAFKLSGDQAVTVADTLANAANAAQGSIADIGLGLKQSAAAASLVGVSFKDTTALLTLLAKNGLTASDAGTSLRTAFIRLVAPSKQASAILKELNITLRDQQGNLRPEVFAEFAEAQRGLTKATQDRNTALVFGQDALRAEAVLGTEGAAGLARMRNELELTGTAARVAGARMTGLKGSTANLSNELEAFGLTIGQIATPAVETLVDQLAQFVSLGNDAVGVAGDLNQAFKQIPGAEAGESRLGQIAKDIAKFSPSTPVGILNIGKAIKAAVTTTEDELGSLGANSRSAIEDAGRVAAQGAVGFGEQITRGFNTAMNAAATAIERDIDAVFGRAAAQARLGSAAAGRQVLNLEFQGAGDTQIRGALEKQLADQRRLVAVLEARDADKSKIDAAKQAAIATQDRIDAINSSIQATVNANKSKTDAAARAATDEAAKARAKADAAFLQSQEDARTRQERFVSLADDTPGLQDDIRRQEQLRALITKQITGIKASTLDEEAKQQALRALRDARNATTDEIKRLNIANKQQIAQQRQDALEQVAENLALRTQIAEARGVGTSAIVRRINAEIANQLKVVARAKAAKKGVLEAILALEELRRKKRDLLDQQKKDAVQDKAASGFSGFEFLQKTQGFASNLLGNLIPGFATGGLVGNTSNLGPITDPGLGFADQVPFGNQLDRANQRGVRPVQVDTTNALLRQILATLGGRHTQPPEIAFNRRWGAAGFDTL